MPQARKCFSEIEEFSSHEFCVFCKTKGKSVLYGKIYKIHKAKYGNNALVLHYFCMLMSSEIKQNGTDKQGVLGFFPKDIIDELNRAKNINCKFCHKNGATVRCCQAGCAVKFHLPCGVDRGSVHQFVNYFESFCPAHTPKQDIPSVSKSKSKDLHCLYCSESVDITCRATCVWPSCCPPSENIVLLHRECTQKAANNAGYYFMCPICRNKEKFREEMQRIGIFIPDQDASWESEPNAFRSHLERGNGCEAKKCSCPKGSKFKKNRSGWQLELCRVCGGNGVHLQCSDRWDKSKGYDNFNWLCQICRPVYLENKSSLTPERQLQGGDGYNTRDTSIVENEDGGGGASLQEDSNLSNLSAVYSTPNNSVSTRGGEEEGVPPVDCKQPVECEAQSEDEDVIVVSDDEQSNMAPLQSQVLAARLTAAQIPAPTSSVPVVRTSVQTTQCTAQIPLHSVLIPRTAVQTSSVLFAKSSVQTSQVAAQTSSVLTAQSVMQTTQTVDAAVQVAEQPVSEQQILETLPVPKQILCQQRVAQQMTGQSKPVLSYPTPQYQMSESLNLLQQKLQHSTSNQVAHTEPSRPSQLRADSSDDDCQIVGVSEGVGKRRRRDKSVLRKKRFRIPWVPNARERAAGEAQLTTPASGPSHSAPTKMNTNLEQTSIPLQKVPEVTINKVRLKSPLTPAMRNKLNSCNVSISTVSNPIVLSSDEEDSEPSKEEMRILPVVSRKRLHSDAYLKSILSTENNDEKTCSSKERLDKWVESKINTNQSNNSSVNIALESTTSVNLILSSDDEDNPDNRFSTCNYSSENQSNLAVDDIRTGKQDETGCTIVKRRISTPSSSRKSSSDSVMEVSEPSSILESCLAKPNVVPELLIIDDDDDDTQPVEEQTSLSSIGFISSVCGNFKEFSDLNQTGLTQELTEINLEESTKLTKTSSSQMEVVTESTSVTTDVLMDETQCFTVSSTMSPPSITNDETLAA